MFKKIAVEVYERVIKSYKSTLVGLGLAVGVVVLEQLGAALGAVEAGWAGPVAALCLIVGSALKSKAAQYPKPPVE